MTKLINDDNQLEFRRIAANAAMSARNNTGQRDDPYIEDQVSIAVIKIIEKFDRVGDDNVRNPIGLAWSVAYNAVRDEIKSRTLWGRTRPQKKEYYSIDDGDESALWRRVSSAYFWDFSPYDEIDSRVSVPPLLTLLEPQEVYVITRFFFYRDKQEEIADALGFDQGAVSNIKKRALHKMRRAFEKDGTL